MHMYQHSFKLFDRLYKFSITRYSVILSNQSFAAELE